MIEPVTNEAQEASMSKGAMFLGYAGLLPQAIAVALVLEGGQLGYAALVGGIAYAALIFSFLGGVWWGQALVNGRGGAGAYLIAVLPSLIGLAFLLPILIGWDWQRQVLVCLSLLIILSPLIDLKIGFASKSFLRLRWHLSIGLGVLTFALGVLARNTV